jgi:hypothetical protein
MRVRHWSKRQLKKARNKRSLSRAKKRGYVYGGYVVLQLDGFAKEGTDES